MKASLGNPRRPGPEQEGGEGQDFYSPIISGPRRGKDGKLERNKPLTGLTQPWREFWPPVAGSDLDHQLRNQFPDVFAWQFHPNRLFEHPWRSWTLSDGHPAPPSVPAVTVDPLSAQVESSEAGSVMPRPDLHRTAPNELQEQRRQIDKFIDDFPIVQPKFFRYISPLPRYELEKPYKVQLPRLGAGFPQTNLEAQPYRVNVFDLSGQEHLFSMAEAGFQYSRCPVAIPTKGLTEAETEASYLPLLSDWLKSQLDCEEVLVFAYNVSVMSFSKYRGLVHELQLQYRKHNTSRSPTEIWKSTFCRVHCGTYASRTRPHLVLVAGKLIRCPVLDATENICQARLQLYFPEKGKASGRRIRFLK